MTPKAAAARGRWRWPRFDPVTAIAVAACSILAFGAGWAVVVSDPLGGEPTMTAAIERRAAPTAAQPTSPAAPENHGTTRNGVPVVRPGEPLPTTAGPVIIRIPGASERPETSEGARSAPGPVEKAMLEDSRFGTLPRIGADGRRPLDVYARPSPKPQGEVARVAIVVGGLGVSRDATLEALRVLPPEISLAFSPYASDIGDLVGEARKQERETLIQAPMEPFDYPSNDPGPQTLLTSLPASANLDRLRWALGRASGYVGVAPLTGGRFLESGEAVQPVFVELARRGLMFVDAAGPRGGAQSAARAASLPHAAATVAIDASPDAASIDAALARLENEAKAGGVAVGWTSASPLALRRIAAWRAGLTARGVTLVPVSAAAGAQKPS